MVHSIVVGGTKGLGRVVAKLFAKRGDVVSVIGRNSLPEEDFKHGNIKSFSIDISDQKNINTILDKIVKTQGNLNYCVFLQRYRGSKDTWNGEFETSVTATKNIIDYLTPYFTDQGDKAITIVSSVFAKHIGKGQPISYHVMKAALEQLMRFYAVNLGDKQIRSNGVTPFTFLKEESEKYYLENTDLMGLYDTIVPLKRLGTTLDIAKTIEFLCSPSANFITGQNLTVDGGLSLVWPETLARSLKEL